MNILLQVLLVTLGLLSVNGVQTKDQCDQGPSYWCKNLKTARQCGKNSYCENMCWALKMENTEVCSLCKDAIKAVDKYLGENGTKQEIEATLMELCKDVPIAELSTECQQVISEDFDMLYDEILVLIGNGDLVCGALGLCSASASLGKAACLSGTEQKHMVDHFVHQLPSLVKDAIENHRLPVAAPMLIEDVSNDCRDCQAFLKDIQTAIKSNEKIVSEWKKTLKSECATLGPKMEEICNGHMEEAIASIVTKVYSDHCEKAVNNYFQKLLDELAGEDTMTVCKAIDMCGYSKVKAANGPCTDCKNFFGDFEKKIMQNSSFVDGLDRKLLSDCQKAGEFAETNNVVATLASFYCLQEPSFLQKKCSRYVAMTIRTSINRIIVECERAVKKYLPKFWRLIGGSSPEQICEAIDFCDASIKPKQSVKLNSQSFLKVPKTGDNCKDCTTFMTDLQGVAKNNQSIINDLTDLVKEQCDQLGPGLSELCTKAVDMVVPDIVDAIENNDVGTICTTILMCSAPPTEPPKGGDLCTDCVAFTKDWQMIIQNNQSVVDQLSSMIADECNMLGSDFEKLDNFFDQAAVTYCKQLPSFLQNKCDEVAEKQIKLLMNAVENNCSTFVKDILPSLWGLISDNDAEDICSTLYFCDNVQHEVAAEKIVFEPTVVEHEPKLIASSEACELCTVVVGVLEREIAKNSTEEAIAATLAKVCSFYSSDIRAECEKFIETYGREVVDLLISEYSAEQVCAKLSLCVAKSALTVKASVSCEICETVAESLVEILGENSTEKEIIEAVEKVCTILPSNYRTECDALIKEYGDQIVQLLINSVSPGKLCSTLGLCKSSSFKMVPKAADYCTDCTTFMTDLQGVAKNNQSIIDDLTDLVKQQCDQFGPGLSELDVGTICTTILMCSAPPTEPPKGGDLCKDCIAFTEDWQAIIQNNKSVIDQINSMISDECNQLGSDFEKLDNLLEQSAVVYCKQLPSLFQNKCDKVALKSINQLIEIVQSKCASLVKDFLPYVWNLISYNSAEQICSTVYMCDALKHSKVSHRPVVEKLTFNAPVSNAKPIHKKEKDVSDPISCAVCRIVVHELDRMIEGNRTEAAILSALERVCSVVTGVLKAECRKFIKTYGKDVVDMLINEVESGVICSRLFLCSARHPVAETAKNSVSCELCETVAEALDDLLEKNATETDIIAAVEKVCSILPSAYRTECDDLIAQYGKTIIQLLVNAVSPQKLCSELGLCSATLKANSVSCELCETVAEALDDLLEKNATETDIIAAVEKVCSILPSAYRTECDDLIAQYGKTIIQLLVNAVSPQKLCSELGLCSAALKAASEACDLCVVIVTEVDHLLGEKRTEADIIKAVEKVCSILPSQYSGLCKIMIDEYGPKLIQAFIDKIDPSKICSTIGLCSTKLAVSKASEGCDLCVVIVTEVDHLLGEKRTEADIIKAVEKVCSILPSQYSGLCKIMIDEYGPKLIQAFIDKIDPSKICSTIGLCSTKLAVSKASEGCDLCVVIVTEVDHLLGEKRTEADIIKAVEKVCSILPSQYSGLCKIMIDEYGPKLIQAFIDKIDPSKICSTIGLCSTKLAVSKSSEICDLCVLAITEIDKLLGEKRTEADIIKAVEKVCSILPKQYSGLCDALIDQYGPEIINAFVKEIDPSKICSAIGICASKLAVAPPKTTPLCFLCQVVVVEIDRLILRNRTEAAIIHAIEIVCDVVPSKDKAECDRFIAKYSDLLIKLAMEALQPEVICYYLRVCNGEQKLVMTSANIDVCPLCQLVAGELDKLLTEKSTEAEIEAALDKVCSLLPGNLSAQCDAFIKDNAPALIELLAQEITPAHLCPALGLCPKKLVSNDVCTTCKYLISFLHTMLGNNATKEDIEKALDTVCSQLPQAFKQECDDMVAQYTPEIIALADHIIDPDYVCLHLGLCGGSKKKKLLGTNPCTYGPSYWCRDEASAAKCNATEHCRLHVWN